MTVRTTNHFMRLSQLGYTRLVPIVPPDAKLSENSSLYKRLTGKNPEDARGKAPGVKGPYGWRGYDWMACDDVELTKWHDMGAGVGVKCGRGLAAIDADTLDKSLAKIVLQTVEKHVGARPPVRFGQYPKALYLLRTDPDFQYARVEFGERDERGRLRERVEILSEGRQFVAHGIHPKTKKPYDWVNGLPRRDELPFASTATLLAILEELRVLLPAAADVVREGMGAETEVDQDTLRGDPELVEKAIQAMRNVSKVFPNREEYVKMAYALRASLPDDQAFAKELWLDWCAKWEDGDNDPEVAIADFERAKPPYRIGAQWLFEKAEETADEPISFVAEKWFDATAEQAPLFPENSPKAFEEAAVAIRATPYSFVDPTDIPRREFLYGRHYIRQFVSATVAPSGVGKSSLIIAEALAMASGKPLLGAQVAGPLRVWLWNGEDPRDELERRIAATMMHYGLTREDIGDRLFVDTGREMEIILATDSRAGVKIAEPVSAAIIETIRANRIDVTSVDPFVSSHRVPENDNGAIDAVTKRWARIADVTRSAIELVHHVRKLNGGDVTIEDSRGAVALLATARSKRALAKMSKSEADRLGCAEFYQRLFRVGDERNNLALPGSDDSLWFELKSVPLGNGGAGREGVAAVDALLEGDTVGVVSLLRLEQAAAAVSGDEQDRALALLASGEWRRDVRAGEAWAGVAIAQAMNLDLDDAGDKATAKRILGEWIKGGKLRAVSRKDANRRLREYVEPVSGAGEADNLSSNGGHNAFD